MQLNRHQENKSVNEATDKPDAAPNTAEPAETITELFLIRHGNAKRLNGETYVTAPLTELGRKQAELTGEYLQAQAIQFDGFYCSPLKRAVQTATIIGEQIGQTPGIREGIHEMEYREFPTTIAAELLARTGMLNRYFEGRIGRKIRYPMVGRVANGLLRIFEQHGRGRLCMVVHGGVVSSVLSWYFPRERQRWWRETVGNCSITRLEIAQGRAALLEYDSVAHLGKLADSAHLRNYTLSGQNGV